MTNSLWYPYGYSIELPQFSFMSEPVRVMYYELQYIKIAQKLHMTWTEFSRLPFSQRLRLTRFCDAQAEYEYRRSIGDRATQNG